MSYIYSKGVLTIKCDCGHEFKVDFEVESTGREKCPKCNITWGFHMDFWNDD